MGLLDDRVACPCILRGSFGDKLVFATDLPASETSSKNAQDVESAKCPLDLKKEKPIKRKEKTECLNFGN